MQLSRFKFNLHVTTILVVLLLLSISNVTGQDKHDYQWLFSAKGNGTLMDFNNNPPAMMPIYKELGMSISNTSICDAEGNLMFYTNGCHIANASHQIMENGENINNEFVMDGYCNGSGGAPITNGAISIPYPGSPERYLLFNRNLDIMYDPENVFYLGSSVLYYNEIDMSYNNGEGKVLIPKKVLINDTISSGLTATLHKNGEDWFLLVAGTPWTNCIYILKVTTEGVQPKEINCNGNFLTRNSKSMVATFSPDGKKYIRMSYLGGVQVYDFDNETGELSNGHLVDTFPGDEPFNATVGATVAPGSRYLYVSARTKLYQYDLWAEDIFASRIIVAYLDNVNIPYAPSFERSALGPDGKIYIVGGGTAKLMHVINYPDCPGIYCSVEQRAIELLTFSHGTIPNLPHFRNKPSGVDCDSIASSLAGSYDQSGFRLYPNPVSDFMTLDWDNNQPVYLEVLDLTGRTVIHSPTFFHQTQIQLTSLNPGLYLYKLHKASDHQVITVGKIMKQ